MPKQKLKPQNKQGPSTAGLVFFENRTKDKQADEMISALLPTASITDNPGLAEFKLTLTDEHLQLQLNQTGAPGAVYADFISGKARHRLGQGELIYKAMGLSKFDSPRIVDVTAGLGRDAFVLASKGCKVVLIERSPIIYLLLSDALQRARGNAEAGSIVDRMEIINMDARAYLSLEDMPLADIVYLDPMYPESKKSALVKKEMQLFQKLLDKNATGDDLLPLALKKAKHRAVVKRPLKGKHLGQLEPDYSIKGKSIRFDVYITSGRYIKP